MGQAKLSTCDITGDDLHMRRPCDECPWRKDAVRQFPAERFRVLAPTAYELAETMFACHKTPDDRPRACAGFLLNGAAHNLSVRLSVMRGDIDLGDVSDGGHELHASYVDMAVANGVRRSDPALRRCRTD